MITKTDKMKLARNQALVRDILLRDWDPIGVSDIPEAKDEYDSYADTVFSMLINQKADTDEIASYLFRVATERMRLADHGMAELCNRAATAVVALRSDF